MKKIKDFIVSACIIIGTLGYGVGFIGFGLYYNYQYANNNGFGKWITLGMIEPTIKALVWPYIEGDKLYDKHKTKSPLEQTLEHFSKSIHASNKATKIINSMGAGINTMDSETYEKYMRHLLDTIDHSAKVDVEELNKLYSNFGTIYKRRFLGGHVLIVMGLKENNTRAHLGGQLLLDKWSDWYEQNQDKIRNTL